MSTISYIVHSLPARLFDQSRKKIIILFIHLSVYIELLEKLRKGKEEFICCLYQYMSIYYA